MSTVTARQRGPRLEHVYGTGSISYHKPSRTWRVRVRQDGKYRQIGSSPMRDVAVEILRSYWSGVLNHPDPSVKVMALTRLVKKLEHRRDQLS